MEETQNSAVDRVQAPKSVHVLDCRSCGREMTVVGFSLDSNDGVPSTCLDCLDNGEVPAEPVRLLPESSILEYRPSLFKDLPESLFKSSKLFAVETQKIANKALLECSSCKKRCFITMGRPGFGNSYAFHVICKICKKHTEDFPVLIELQHSKISMMEALQSTVDSWNLLNQRR